MNAKIKGTPKLLALQDKTAAEEVNMRDDINYCIVEGPLIKMVNLRIVFYH